jgi:hypothetical protein
VDYIFHSRGFDRLYAWAVTDFGWRHEKLPIAVDFLSSYTKVEAGYNP